MPEEILARGVHVQELRSGVRPIAAADSGIACFVGETRRGPVGEPVEIGSELELDERFGRRTRTWGMGTTVADFFANGGRRAVVVRLPDDPDLAAFRSRGLAALTGLDAPDLLVLPPRRPQGRVPDRWWPAAAESALAHRMFLLVDPPRGLAPAQVPAWVEGLGLLPEARRSAALYHPRVRRPSPRAGAEDLTAAVASGAIAGVYARTDRNRGVWKAPAGSDAALVGVLGAEAALDEADSDLLAPSGVNSIREFPGSGTVLWGARTLRAADAPTDDYKYVPVRRLSLYLERSIGAGIGWAVFEPDAEPLWAQLRLQVGSFMEGLWRQGAFQGARSQEAYLVKCDATTTTAADIAGGVVNVVVGFAALKPAELVILRFQQRTAQTG